MTYSPIKQSFLPIGKAFSKNLDDLQSELTKAYSEISYAINEREIGVYDQIQSTSGQFWYQTTFNSNTPQKRRQGYRRVFTGTGTPVPFAHGISDIVEVTDYWGIVKTTASEWRKLPYVSTSSLTRCASMLIQPTQIFVNIGADFPAIESWVFVVEYLLT